MASHGYMTTARQKQDLIFAERSGQGPIGNECKVGCEDRVMLLGYIHNREAGSDLIESGCGQYMPAIPGRNIDVSVSDDINAIQGGGIQRGVSRLNSVVWCVSAPCQDVMNESRVARIGFQSTIYRDQMVDIITSRMEVCHG